jgi:hypothetical protein
VERDIHRLGLAGEFAMAVMFSVHLLNKFIFNLCTFEHANKWHLRFRRQNLTNPCLPALWNETYTAWAGAFAMAAAFGVQLVEYLASAQIRRLVNKKSKTAVSVAEMLAASQIYPVRLVFGQILSE